MTNQYDAIVLDDYDLRENTKMLFELENNCVTLATIDMECVLSIALATITDLYDKPQEDIQHLVENIILDTTDIKHYDSLYTEEIDAVEELKMVAKAAAIVLRLVLNSIEQIGLPYGHFPYRYRHLLPNNAFYFVKEPVTT